MTMNNLKSLLLLPALLLSNPSIADTNLSVGFGIQHGGAAGVQLAVSPDAENKHKVRAALGIFGGSLGYEYFPHQKFSVGVSAFETEFLGTSNRISWHVQRTRTSSELLLFTR